MKRAGHLVTHKSKSASGPVRLMNGVRLAAELSYLEQPDDVPISLQASGADM